MFLVKLTWRDPEACERESEETEGAEKKKKKREKRGGEEGAAGERFPVLDTTVCQSESYRALLEPRCTRIFYPGLPSVPPHIVRDICLMRR